MAETAKEEKTALQDLHEFVQAIGSRYQRVPALKRLGRLVGAWFLSGLAFVVVCIAGETIGVGFSKAKEIYWDWWVWPPFVFAATPIAWTLSLSLLELAMIAVFFPFRIIGDLIGPGPTAFFKTASKWLVFAAIAFWVAWAARDSARKAVAPASPTKAVAAAVASAPAATPAVASAATSPRSEFWKNFLLVLGWLGVLGNTALKSVVSAWAKRFLLDGRPEVVIYGPDDNPKRPHR